ncbi:ABC transporter permease [Candidatus Acetothermia bacterium]|jgi:simple sugar transport system permease protein|nr:ABC transporter permease [Candidatus Acetothermia bacterium]MCI2426020.1 ABC transporter permease [Candidatus Acetothermia bacterium]MCI2427813.1 ABC transporter permease [Candidatus Acetothermia bacterium]MCI2428331.1 ABC transporter permease [Candidatus Acetothermia bacterium]
MIDIWNIVDIALFAAMLRMATPLVLAAIGGVFTERAGVINIGLEGMMMLGAFWGVATSHWTGSPWLGMIVGMIVGGLAALVHAFLSIKYNANQIVSALGINILALGLTPYLSAMIWGSRGASAAVTGLPRWEIPLIRDIPVLSEFLGPHSPTVFLMVIIVIAAHLILFKTRWGLHIRATGEFTKAAATAGVNIQRTRYICVVISGVLAGLAGVHLALGHLAMFSWGMTGGRGFIALAVMIFGNWRPYRAIAAGLLFGFVDALQIRLQGIGVPVQFPQMLPYLITIAVLAGVMGRARPPSDIGKPYD